jgi:hypothetical protein
MTTPVLFLDDASRFVGVADRESSHRIAMTLLDTLKRLRKCNKKFALNTVGPIANYQVADGFTLQSILGGVLFKEEWDFIRSLNDRSPFAAGLESSLLQEIELMEFRTRTGKVTSSALAWATLLDSATVSFQAHPDWSEAWVDAAFSVLEEDGEIRESEVRVRNASQVTHVDQHADWLKVLGLSEAPSAVEVWRERAERFPGLRFLPRVEKDLSALEGSGVPFLQALSALEALSKDVSNWKPESAWPVFSTKATPEAEQRKRLCWVVDDATEKKELFDMHTRFTGGFAGRVHFRVDAQGKSVVVAYVGGKLEQEISG